MRATRELKPLLIIQRMRSWVRKANDPQSTLKDRARARKNFRHLLREYPNVAKKEGYNEATVLEDTYGE